MSTSRNKKTLQRGIEPGRIGSNLYKRLIENSQFAEINFLNYHFWIVLYAKVKIKFIYCSIYRL